MQSQISIIRPSQPPAVPRPRLERAGTQSYHTADVPLFAAWLEQRGWQKADPRSQYEVVRFWLGPRLLVCYRNGTILVQGVSPERTHALLAELAGGGE